MLVLSLVTLGIYYYVWLWRTTREADAYTGGQTRAHGTAKWALFLSLGGIVMAFVLMASVVGAAASGGEGAMSTAIAGFTLMILALVAASIAGFVLLYVALWRLWSMVRAEETRQGMQSPLSPGLLLALSLIPYVNMVGMFYAIYRTQAGLNRVWSGGGSAAG